MDDLSAPKSTITLAALTKTISPEQSVRLVLAGSVAWVCAAKQGQSTNLVLISANEDGLAADVLPQFTDDVIDIGLIRTGVQEGKATAVVAVSRAQTCYIANLMLGSTKRIQPSSVRDIQAQSSPKVSTTLRLQAPKKLVRHLK